jgi:uncharacterized membrane protein YeaQ/YmgE (transglycosylase-associated protein family)
MGLFSILWAIVAGFVVGVLARWLFPGTVDLGFWATVAVGVGGSIVGGLIGGLLSPSKNGKYQPAGLAMSIIGAVIVIWAWRHFMT